MSGAGGRGDSRLNVARYQIDRLAREAGEAEAPPEEQTDAGAPTMEQRAQYVELAIQQAIRRGDFDDLPGAGKPLEDLGQISDPDWWIRRKIEREQITGLGPPALTLRTENAALDDRLDALHSERAVRDALEDFNRRVIHARRQLQGGPPVVTPPRDIDAELENWRQRRSARYEALRIDRENEEARLAAMSRKERRKAKRGRG